MYYNNLVGRANIIKYNMAGIDMVGSARRRIRHTRGLRRLEGVGGGWRGLEGVGGGWRGLEGAEGGWRGWRGVEGGWRGLEGVGSMGNKKSGKSGEDVVCTPQKSDC